MKRISWILFIWITGCAQVTSLNLQKHQFGKIPTQIVWIQVAGLAPEHLALLKYSMPSIETKTAFEQSLCIGQTWEYNLYDLRPDAFTGFMSQLTGKKNIKNQCSDYQLKPIWSYLADQGYSVGIFEGELKPEQSLMRADTCQEGREFLNNTILWKMAKNSKGKTFHVNENKKYRANTVYYDKSCSQKECFSTLSANIEKTFKTFSRSSKNFVYLIRNFQYANYLKQKNIQKAKAELSELNAILSYFQGLASKNRDMLVLLTSAKSIGVDFPRNGKEWQAYERDGKFLMTRNSKLLSSVYVSGARAENFCGIYDQSQILKRIFSGAKQQGLEFSIINPFE